MLENIRSSYTDNQNEFNIGREGPEVILLHEIWEIDKWLEPYLLGLKYLTHYHGFLFAKCPELGKDVLLFLYFVLLCCYSSWK